MCTSEMSDPGDGQGLGAPEDEQWPCSEMEVAGLIGSSKAKFDFLRDRTGGEGGRGRLQFQPGLSAESQATGAAREL